MKILLFYFIYLFIYFVDYITFFTVSIHDLNTGLHTAHHGRETPLRLHIQCVSSAQAEGVFEIQVNEQTSGNPGWPHGTIVSRQ